MGKSSIRPIFSRLNDSVAGGTISEMTAAILIAPTLEAVPIASLLMKSLLFMFTPYPPSLASLGTSPCMQGGEVNQFQCSYVFFAPHLHR
jgi:hypothetical protein